MTDLWELFVSFARSSLLGFGGGPSMVLLIQSEAVELRGWLDAAEFLDAYAFANALPSPIATKLAAFVGFHVAGWPGALAALVGVSLPTALIMVVAASFLMRNRESPVLAAILGGIRPAVVALLLYVVWDFMPAVFGTTPEQWLREWYVVLIAVVALYLLVRRKTHPVPLILGGGAVGLIAALIAGS